MTRCFRVLVLVVFASWTLSADAAARFVLNVNDSGAGSLRDAIGGATAGDVVVFDAALRDRTITLTSGQIVVDKNLVIVSNGTGARVTVSGNRASRVFEVTATVTIVGLTIRDGYVEGGFGGGGILNTGNLTLVESTVTENVSTGHGGGITNKGTMTIVRTTISENIARDSYGGGIGNYNGGTLVLQNCTISGNVAAASGGGIDNFDSVSAVVFFSTIAFNYAAGAAGGINGSDSPNGVTLNGTILANNHAPAGPDCTGSLVSGDYNLVGRTAGCAFTGTTTHDVLNQDPLLGALQLNGGETRTHPIRPGSPAMDTVPSAVCTGAFSTTDDARGLARPQDGGATGSTSCDAGAYEAKKPIVVNSRLEPGDSMACTLRDAFLAANTNATVNGCGAGTALPVPDRIVFAVSGRIELTAGALVATERVLVDGPGATRLTVSGGFSSGVFELQNGTQENAYGLAGITVADGRASYGAGVSFRGVDYVEGDDTLAIDRLAFVDNVTTDDGGALRAAFQRGVEIDASSVSCTIARGNSSNGILVVATPMTIRNSTIGETGGGIYDMGIYSQVWDWSTLVRIIGCTIRGAREYGVAAESIIEGSSAVVEYRNSIISGHVTDLRAGTGGVFVSGGYNIIGDGSGAPEVTGDLKNANAMLGLHLWSGGPTMTIAPHTGSPAIDRIPFERCAVFTDQRGVPRPLDGDGDGGPGCESGAFETSSPIVVNSLLDTPDPAKCRLRDAIQAANTNTAQNGCVAGLAEAQDLVTFGVTGTISLAEHLSFTGGVAVRGPGATKLTIQGNFNDTELALGSGQYTFTGLTMENGLKIVLLGSASSTLSVAESVFRGQPYVGLGALYAQGTNAVQLLRSSFLETSNGPPDVALIALVNAECVIESCTLSRTSGPEAVKCLAVGGGSAARVRLKSSTLKGSASLGVRAAAVSGASASDAVVEYAGTIVSGFGASFDVTSGTGISLGYNLSSDGTGNLIATGDKPSVDPLLGPLSYHGGETPVFDPLPASPAKDAIPTGKCGQAFDQRGFTRPFGAACDIGAVERRIGGDANGDGFVNVSDVFHLINFLFASGPVPVGEGDVNGDGDVSVSDVFYLINDLFAGGPDPV